jgi:hypothetical protein
LFCFQGGLQLLSLYLNNNWVSSWAGDFIYSLIFLNIEMLG